MSIAGPTECSRVILCYAPKNKHVETPPRVIYLIRNICGIRCGRVRYGNAVRHCITAKDSLVWYEIPDSVALVHGHKLALEQEKDA